MNFDSLFEEILILKMILNFEFILILISAASAIEQQRACVRAAQGPAEPATDDPAS
jgi:hypothetical protein